MLKVRNITKKFETFVLKNISFEVKRGEYFVLLGKSGVGKTMLLEIIAGLLEPDSGNIGLNGHDITKEKIQKRYIGIVYQDQAIFPHLSVHENIAYPLRSRGIKRKEINARVEQLAEKTGIISFLNRKPETLSCGQVQRVALARTLATEPKCLLLDEPISSLDIEARSEIRVLLRKINRSGQTMIHVTHDYEEAISLATRIAVMEDGKISQVGSPHEIFQHPNSEFVAKFIGIKNVFKGELRTSGDELAEFVTEGIRFFILSDERSGTGFMILRNEDITVSNMKPYSSARNTFKGIITDIEMNRLKIEVTVDIGVEMSAMITRDSLEKLGLHLGKAVWINFKATAAKYFEE
ncbi:ABC transporter ATP-binding protein [Candidatus Latescibacterota bacterium]